MKVRDSKTTTEKILSNTQFTVWLNDDSAVANYLKYLGDVECLDNIIQSSLIRQPLRRKMYDAIMEGNPKGSLYGQLQKHFNL